MRTLFKVLAALALLGAAVFGVMGAHAALPVGDSAPPVTTQAVLAGKPFEFRLNDALKKGPVVLYFFPAAFTTGCTIEAHEFSDATPQFAEAGAMVIGLSHDPIDKLSRFSVTECRDRFAVGVASSDVMDAYKVKLPGLAMADRTSYVIAPDGKIILSYSSLSPRNHVEMALTAVKTWRAAQAPK